MFIYTEKRAELAVKSNKFLSTTAGHFSVKICVMPFRFNHKDLAVLATQPSEQFTKEGLLWVKEKDGKLFNKSENFSERLCRLYGNLLLVFKGKEKSSECVGVIVLERFQVVGDNTFKKYGFIIEFDENEEKKYEFAAGSKEEYNDWMSFLQSSSYEKLKQHLMKLRREIQAVTGQDPIPDNYPNTYNNVNENRNSLIGSSYSEDMIMMEMCVACNNLFPEKDITPTAMIKVYTVVPPNTEWQKHSQTEISEETRDPNFLRTIVFTEEYTPFTRLKFVVYDCADKEGDKNATIGQVVCTIQEIQQAPNWQLSLKIMNMEMLMGTLVIQGWRRESNGRFKHCLMSTGFEKPSGVDKIMIETPRTYIVNVAQRGFHFPTKDGRDLKFQEFLAESSLCYKIPKLLLGLFIAEEKESVMELHNIGQLHPEWERIKQTAQNNHFDLVHNYSTNLADLYQYEECYFKKSIEKTKRDLEFIPTNLHIQRLCVNENTKDFYYDVVTVGAPAAHSLKFKHGGLKRLIFSIENDTRKALEGFGEEERLKSGYIKASHVKDVIKRTKQELHTARIGIKKAIEERNPELLSDFATVTSNKIGELLGLCETSFVQEASMEMVKARTNSPEIRVHSTVIFSNLEDQNIQNLDWKWTGTEYKPSTSEQKDDDCGVRHALTEFITSVDYASKTYSLPTELVLLEETLHKAIDSLCSKTNVLMRFMLMQDEVGNTGAKEIRHRRDIVLSQALTPVICGFAVIFAQRIADQTFLEQITNIGLLIHYESLLTTHGDEMGMLEDMHTGVSDLRNVTFKIISADADAYPTLTGKRSGIVVEFPVKPSIFRQLPEKLQKRQIIRLHPVLFSMGINEQATLAEKFGDTSLQETINSENLASFQVYLDAFLNFNSNNGDSRSSKALPLVKLMDQLKTNVNVKRCKNYEILLTSEELCFRLNGLRLTSCKSAKDRSSMAVTLETVRTLEREHDMAENVSNRVLSSIRSQGTRPINSFKNVGVAKYAFNKVQVMALPSLYRPPEGTIGKYVQT